MEPEIKRINFFDGLFLRQAEFQAEQLYHQHMRRRLNFMLFDGSGVVQAQSTDLQILPTGGKTFRVNPGMAISHRTDLMEGREIVLKSPSPVLDLATAFTAGTKVIVTIHYAEIPTDPQTVVAPTSPTRVEEVPVISMHNAAQPLPAAGSLPGGESPIVLGTIDFDTIDTSPSSAVSTSQRQTARLRAALIAAAAPPSPGAPTISNTSPSPLAGTPSAPIAATLTGTNLAGATLAISGTGVTLGSISTTSTSISVTLTVASGATPGQRIITITNATGSIQVPFQVNALAAPPTLLKSIPTVTNTELNPAIGKTNDTFSIYGRDLAIDLPNLPVVELRNAGNTTTTHTFVVNTVATKNQTGFGTYDEITARVGPFGSATPIAGRIRVTTSAGSVLSTEFFTIQP